MIQEIQHKRAREQEHLIINSIYKDSVDFSKYPLFNNVIPQAQQDKIKIGKQAYKQAQQRLINIDYDIKNNKSYSFYNYPYKKLMREQDKTSYKIINKKPIYKDISVFQILKNSYKQHKISKVLYKDSIKRIKDNKPLKDKVINIINSYYKTIKSNSNKTSLTALKRQQDKRTRINYNGYSVLIKKRYSDIINNHINKLSQENKPNYRQDRLILIDKVIKQEFKIKLAQDNKTI